MEEKEVSIHELADLLLTNQISIEQYVYSLSEAGVNVYESMCESMKESYDKDLLNKPCPEGFKNIFNDEMDKR